MKLEVTQKLICLTMAGVMTMTSGITAFANQEIEPRGTVYHKNQKLKVTNLNIREPIMKSNGYVDYDNFAPAQVSWTNPTTKQVYQAYCVNPAKPGYGDTADYDITVEKFDGDCIVDAGGSGGKGKRADSPSCAGNKVSDFLEGAVNAGYPTVKAETLFGNNAAHFGVSQERLNYAAYLATKMAIWSGIHNNYGINTWSQNEGAKNYPKPLRDKVVAATKSIYQKAAKYKPSSGKSQVTLTAGNPTKVGTNYEVVIKIGNTQNNVAGADMSVEMAAGGKFTDGLKICDMKGSEYPKKTTSSNNERYTLPANVREFKAILPEPSTPEYNLTKEIRLFAEQNKKILLYGRTSRPETQNYILAGGAYDNPTVSFEIHKGDNPPPPPDKPDEPGKGKLRVIKLDATDGKTPLEGFTFDCYDSQGHLVDSGTTDKNGEWIPNITESGTYTVVERDTNNGYQLTPPTTLVITVPKDKEATATFQDYPPTTIITEKEDAETGEPIPNVQYEIIQIDGKGAWRATGKTDAQGKITWNNVPDGTYLVREVSTVEGYILDQTPQYVTVRNGQAPSLKFLNSKFPGLTITKIDQQTGETVTSPATFKVEQVDGSYTTTVTTKDGVATLKNIPVGTYKITEVTAPEGYALSDCPEIVYLGKDKNIQVVMKNLKKPILTIEKIDKQTGKPIPGTKFEIKKSDGTKIGTVTTGADGKVTVGMQGSDLGYLDPDVYTVTEVFVPEPYVLSKEHQDIRLNAGDKKSLLFANLEMPSIIVEKYDEQTGEKLPNAQFAIYEQADTARPVAEGMTDEKGQFTSGHIKPGTYVIKELNPPPGYMFSDKTSPDRVIVAKPGDGEIVVKVDNIKLPELTIKKIDSVTKKPIAGVVFEVRLADDTSVQPATVTTDEQGVISIPGLQAGTYQITEISVPEPYILNKKPQIVKLKAGDKKTILFENIKRPTLIVEKIDGTTNKGIPNTTFEISHEKTDGSIEQIGTFRTDKDGLIKLPYVEAGWYIVKETIPAPGYQKPTNPVTRIHLKPGENSYLKTDGALPEDTQTDFKITSGADYPVIGGIVNYPLNSLVIKKADANTGEMLDGATFEVFRITGETSGQNGKLICTVTTDHSGVVVITGLEAGAYAIRETKAPTNYIIAETDMQTVNLKPDGTSVVEVVFRNYPYGNISIEKVDGETKKPLEGATFTVTTADGAVVGDPTYTTDVNGNILVPNLAPGSYIVTETKAPDGYVLSTTPQAVQIGTEGKTISLTFSNYKKGGLLIRKIDGETKLPLQDAEFQITKPDGTIVGDGTYTTDADGSIQLPELAPGSYVITETKAPDGYVLSKQPKTVKIEKGDKVQTLTFENYKKGGLLIQKIDGETKLPLKDAQFKVEQADGTTVGTYTTDADGSIQLPELAPGSYVVTETKAPEGYVLSKQPQTVQIEKGDKVKTLTFENYKKSGLLIQKIDGETKQPLKDAQFKVTKADGTTVGTYTTDADGSIQLPELAPGSYVVTETKAPDGYVLSKQPQTVQIEKGDKVHTLIFENYKKGGLLIQKIDGETKQPLQDAQFKVEQADGTTVGTYTTNADGSIQLPELAPGSYVVTETKAPDGYVLSKQPQTVQIEKGDKVQTLTFENYKKGGLLVRKFDATTKELLAGATFEIKHADGTVVGTGNGLYTTDESGTISLPELEKGTYIITETKAPKGYALSEKPSQTIEIDNTKTYTVDFYNQKQMGVQIIKIDSQTKQPLQGAQFQIWHTGASSSTSVSGGTPAGVLVGTYTTDNNGVINVVLKAGTYEIIETKAPEGYQIDSHKQDIVVKDGEQTSVTFTNTKVIGLEIVKVDKVTQKPLQGATFEVKKPNGEHIGEYTTDANGYIMVSGLESGTYVVSETKAPNGYTLNSVPQTVEVQAGKATRVKFENSKLGNIVIQKLDSATEKPIEGCEFFITTIEGTEIGTFTTDKTGLIHLPHLTAGTYIAKETKAPKGYNLAKPKTFVVKDQDKQYLEGAGNQQTVVIYNDPLGMSQIIKTDAVTGQPVQGAVYVIAALNQGTGKYGQTVMAAGVNAANATINGLHTVIGEYTTNENGIINISNLPEGWYTVQEKTAPEGYERDATIYNFQITGNGVPTILQLTNKPILGKIALTKLSQDYNNNTGWDSGTPLAGAVYNIVDKTGMVVDQLTTGADGTAISNPIKIGTYTLQEVKAPDWYGINPTPLKVTIQKQGQVVSVVAKDPSIRLGVGIKKTSDTRTCSLGDTVNYYITGVGNESNVALDKFTVHDKLPDTKAAQVKYFDTGLWSKKYNFKVAYTTNMNTAYTYLPGVYTSDKHHHIDLYAKNMGLRNGEYVTQVKLEFQDAVAPGFKLMEAMSMQMTVGRNLPNQYQFTNYADVTGRWHDQVVTANSHWTIKIHVPYVPRLPKTGN